MKSYYQHLETTKEVGKNLPITKKPVFRSSAIFPVLQTEKVNTRFLFMGYWLLKRNITSIGFLYTLRSKDGTILLRKYFLVETAKGFTIEVKKLLEELNYSNVYFEGSFEMEIFSTVDLVFPYPAFVVHYYNDKFGTAVHTVGRVYNDIEDFKDNDEHTVPEAGFDIYSSKGFEPFIAFTNGPLSIEYPKVTCDIINKNNEVVTKEFELPCLKPYETVFLLLKKYIDIDEILKSESGTIKIRHNFKGFFPRFMAGNFENEKSALSITHTYYDSSEVTDKKAYWNRITDEFYDCSIQIPFYHEADMYTDLVLYPVFSPSSFRTSFQFLDSEGQIIDESKPYIVNEKKHAYNVFRLNDLFDKKTVDIDKVKSVRVISLWDDKNKIPTRLKFALNVGYSKRELKLPCNICFSSQLGNPEILKKPGTFKWMPILNVHNSEIVLTNSAPIINYQKEAKINIRFYREKDNACIEEAIVIPSNGIEYIKVKDNSKIKNFLEGEAGWITAQSDNPFINGWYFDFSEQGSVAADHTF